MDRYVFPLGDDKYTIELTKEKRVFGYSNFGQYICKIRFLDNIGLPQLEIKGTEKEFYSLMNTLNDFNNNPYDYYDMITYFSSGDTFMFMYIAVPQCNSPSDEDDKITMQVYEDTFYGRIFRLYIELNFYYLENFIFGLYSLLEDIDYLADMGYSSLLEMMGEYESYTGHSMKYPNN